MSYSSMKGYSNLSDEELIERYRHSHESAYIGELYTRYAHLVLGLCFKYLKEESKAQDAVMDIFEQLFNEFKKHQITHFKSWLYMVAKNHCLQELRKRQSAIKKEAMFEDFWLETMENGQQMHLHEEETTATNIKKLEKALSGLKVNQRECIRMFYFEKKTYLEISKKTGHSLNEVKSHIQNGKRNLKNRLLESDE